MESEGIEPRAEATGLQPADTPGVYALSMVGPQGFPLSPYGRPENRTQLGRYARQGYSLSRIHNGLDVHESYSVVKESGQGDSNPYRQLGRLSC